MDESIIVSLIPVGKENAITASELCSYLETDKRGVFEYIRRARKNGAVILSNRDKGGWYQPTEDGNGIQDIAEWLLYMDNQASSIFSVTMSARKKMSKLSGQMSLYDESVVSE